MLGVLFANVMTLKKHQHRIPKYAQYALAPIWLPMLVIGYIVDVAFNIIYGTVLFMELPRHWTLSERLREILIVEKPYTYKWKLAYFFCHYLIEPWDKNHCGLENL